MQTTVIKDKDRVWLEGVNGWFMGDRESSVHAAQAAIMESLGEAISYADLVAVSGLAFRMQVSKKGLCPSSPHPFCGYQCVKRSIQAIPYHIEVCEVSSDDAEKVEKTRQAIIASIDRGIPVQYGNEEDGIIIGYQNQGKAWICYHPLREGGKKTFVETEWPWGIAIFTEHKIDNPSMDQLTAGTLRQAVEMAESCESGDYFVGWAAWDAYLNKLRQLQTADEITIHENVMGNAWIYECLVKYRRIAANYLMNVSAEFDPTSEQHLVDAANLYKKMANDILTDSSHSILTVVPFPWSLKKDETWTTDQRAAQISRLEQAFLLEQQAINHIKLVVP
ncbi:MAG: hypothetical protein P1S60_02775 [Anaerolineae bacterium]|nr:hypothetical protein [Anaerolineae bacterium]